MLNRHNSYRASCTASATMTTGTTIMKTKIYRLLPVFHLRRRLLHTTAATAETLKDVEEAAKDLVDQTQDEN